MNYYSSNDQVIKLWLKDTLKVQDRPKDFKVTEYNKFIDKVSGSTWHL